MSGAGGSDTTYAGVATTDRARNSAAGTAFADLLEQAGQVEETATFRTPEEEAEYKEKQRIKDLFNDILTGANSPYASKSVDELSKGLDEGYNAFGQEIADLADKYGIDYVSVLEGGVLIRNPSPLDNSPHLMLRRGDSPLTLVDGSSYMAAVDRPKEAGLWDGMLADCHKRVNDFFKELRDSQRNWHDTRNDLAARTAIVNLAQTVPGFEDEYTADPQGTIDKYLDELKDGFKDVTFTYANGEISW